ncbi:MAG: Hsp20/alpha crystallin family protein, partial [bacterium]|nr:Hsp20/alpha crystallin family protein [bacterium]
SAIAGVKGDDIDLSIAKDAITIKGFRQRAESIDPNDYLHQELHWGTFSRSVILPADINVDQAKASIKNGLLTIRLPKLAREI